MKSKYPNQHIVVSNKTLRALKRLKKSWGYHNLEEVINAILPKEGGVK